MTTKNPPDWYHYVPLEWVHVKKRVDPATLTQHQRQALWAGIKKTEPALAECLQHDATLAELKRTFNGTVVFEVDDVHRFMNAAQKG
tara:strand:+ start:231 stop:491 length:261 start_codon:yes stop_codon:yes gene_type:complete